MNKPECCALGLLVKILFFCRKLLFKRGIFVSLHRGLALVKSQIHRLTSYLDVTSLIYIIRGDINDFFKFFI